jgi:hypothetical protein
MRLENSSPCRRRVERADDRGSRPPRRSRPPRHQRHEQPAAPREEPPCAAAVAARCDAIRDASCGRIEDESSFEQPGNDPEGGCQPAGAEAELLKRPARAEAEQQGADRGPESAGKEQLRASGGAGLPAPGGERAAFQQWGNAAPRASASQLCIAAVHRDLVLPRRMVELLWTPLTATTRPRG